MVKLSSVAEILNGDRSSNYPSGKDFIAYGIPFINAGHLKNGKIDFSNVDYISKQKYEQLSGAKIQKKDILLCLRGSLGKYAVAEIDAGAPASSIAVIRPNETIIASEFLTCIISSFLFQKQIDLENNGSSQPNLSASSVANFIIPFPPLDEQKRIAEALSDVDELISSLEKLIEKYKSIKATCLQQMFPQKGETTPKMRLPGFTGAWEQRKLSEIVFYTASALSAKDVENDGRYDLYDANSVIGKTNKAVMEQEYITIIKDGAGVGRVRILPAKTAFIGTMGAMMANNSSLLFVYSLLCSADISKKFSGSTIPHIYFKDYGQEQYCVPKPLEQEKIGAFFRNLDNLITLHQRKLDKAKKIKQGMMQQLLTGKIRLV